MNSEKLVNGSLIQYMSLYTRAQSNTRQTMSIYQIPLTKHDVGRDGMLLVVEAISVDKQCPWIQEVFLRVMCSKIGNHLTLKIYTITGCLQLNCV